jgi:FtsH-binding integral membrane protein
MNIPLFDSILRFLGNLTNFLIKLVILLSSFFIIYLGIKFFTEKKSKEGISRLHKAIIFLILGLIIVIIVSINPDIIKDTIKIFSPVK